MRVYAHILTERDRDTNKNTETETNTDRQRQPGHTRTDKQQSRGMCAFMPRYRQRHTETDKDRQRHTDTAKDRHMDACMPRHTQRQTYRKNRDGQGQTEQTKTDKAEK